MRTYSIVVLLLCLHQLQAQSSREIDAAVRRARRSLQLVDRQLSMNKLNWVPNSGKIGAGFDTVVGSPICYTGECQMEGFRRSVFKLIMTQQAHGSCTDQLIPQNVELDCLPSMQMTASTESISTLHQLQQNTKKGLEISASVEAYGNALSYRYSNEIRSMIDTIVEKNSTVYFTRATVTWARLSAFVPALELSDAFKFAIENMPCCNDSIELEQYIREFIIGYFGLTYIKDLLLGGIAQQQILISEENRKKLQSTGFSTKHEASVKLAAFVFSASMSLGVNEEVNKAEVENFKKFSQQSSITTLGGAAHIQSIEEWTKTVPSNPTIVKFSIANTLDLLTTKRFPGDPDILKKQRLIKVVHERYMASPVFCYNNCSQQGLCIASGYFGFGRCRCNAGRTGTDCSAVVQLPTGVLTGPNSQNRCPVGFTKDTRLLGVYNYPKPYDGDLKDLPGCSLVGENVMIGPKGTLCGFVYFDLHILCNGRDPASEPCPSGFSKLIWSQYGTFPTTVWACEKDIIDTDDPPGTLCGFHSSITQMSGLSGSHILCAGYDPGKKKCPLGYEHFQVHGSPWLASPVVSFCARS